MKFSIILALIIAGFLGSIAEENTLPLHDNNNAATKENTVPNFGNALFGFIMAYKNIMPCGFALWNLHPLAPLTVEKFPFDFQNQFYRANGVLSNIVIYGLNNFRLLKFDYDENSGMITYDIIYYNTRMLGQYTMDAWAMVAGYNASMAGYGPLSWEVKDLRSFGEVTIGPNSRNGSMISDFNMNFLVGDVIIDSWNYNWDISFNNFANRWFREFILMLVQHTQEEVNSLYNNILLPMDNQNLENISIKEIVSFFIQQTQLMNESNCKSSQSELNKNN